MDCFRPHLEPARSIYDALVKESDKRKERTCDEWIQEERNVVYREAVKQAKLHNLRVPTMQEVEYAEGMACGHCDYVAQFAYGIVEFMRKART